MNLNKWKGLYTRKDCIQGTIGALVAVFTILLFIIFGDVSNKFPVSPIVGIFLTILVMAVVFVSVQYKFKARKAFMHTLVDYWIAFKVAVLFSLILGILSFSELFSIQFFGSVPFLVILPMFMSAVTFDMRQRESFVDGICKTKSVAQKCRELVGNNPQKIERCKRKFGR